MALYFKIIVMSRLADTTEMAALKVIRRCLKYFERLADLEMSAADAFAARAAENYLKSIIDTNEFKNTNDGKGRI